MLYWVRILNKNYHKISKLIQLILNIIIISFFLVEAAATNPTIIQESINVSQIEKMIAVWFRNIPMDGEPRKRAKKAQYNN